MTSYTSDQLEQKARAMVTNMIQQPGYQAKHPHHAKQVYHGFIVRIASDKTVWLTAQAVQHGWEPIKYGTTEELGA